MRLRGSCSLFPALGLTALLAGTAPPLSAQSGTDDHQKTPPERLPVETTMVAVSDQNELLRFNAADPVTILGRAPVGGLETGEKVLGIDVRPGTGELYALTDAARLYVVNPMTAAAVLQAELAADPTDPTDPFTALAGTAFGMDFDPAADRLRIVSDAEQNLSVDPDTGAVETQGALAFAPGDPNRGRNPRVLAVAYRGGVGAPTQLIGLDEQRDILVRIDPATGEMRSLSRLGAVAYDWTGFDITPGGTALGVLDIQEHTSVVKIDLETGALLPLGYIDRGRILLKGHVAVVPAVRFSADLHAARETDGAVTVTLKRTEGSVGTVSVRVATEDGTAREGADYRAVSRTVVFGPGEVSKTVSVPVVNDPQAEGDESFSLVLSELTGNAALGDGGTATVRISANDRRDRIGPRVVRMGLTGPSRGITGAVLQFDEDLRTDTAEDPRNYALIGVDARGRRTRVPFASAVYEPASREVELRVAVPFRQPNFRTLELRAAGGRGGLKDTSGNALGARRGRRQGRAARFILRVFHSRTVTIEEPDGDRAVLTLRNGGILDGFQVVNHPMPPQFWIVDAVPKESRIDAVVQAARGQARGQQSGIIVIAEIIGLDKCDFVPFVTDPRFNIRQLTFTNTATARF